MVFLLSAVLVALFTNVGSWLIIDEALGIELFFVAIIVSIFIAIIVWKLAFHLKKTEKYNPIWEDRKNPNHQKIGTETAALMLVVHARSRCITVPLLHLIVFYFMTIMGALALSGDIGGILSLLLFFFWFSANYLEVYIDCICDLGDPPKKKDKSKAKSKQALTNLQQKVWDKLVGDMAPAPSPC
jgi:hypothetical protein